MSRSLRQLTSAALAISLAGCAGPDILFPHDYPSRWPPLQTMDKGCLPLTGDYPYYGEAGYASARTGPPTFDMEVLYKGQVIGRPANVNLRHDAENGTLVGTINGEEMKWPAWAEARARGLGTAMAGEILVPSAHIVLSQGNFRCVNGWTTYTHVFDGLGTEAGQLYGSESVRLSLATDRSLIVQHVFDEEVWFLFLSRKRIQGTDWSRFEPLQSR